MGIFITLEGGEGTGKSTQAKTLANRLQQIGKVCVLTREPGGTIEAEAVRELLVTGDVARWSASAEALLNYAARDSHIRELIAPALDAGKTVICDRFIDSTRAYQMYAGDAPSVLINALEASIVAKRLPNLTLVFDLDPKLGLGRAAARGTDRADRFERKGLVFHQKLRDAFLSIASAEPMRCRVIDAAQSIEDVARAVWHEVSGLIDG
jgi:dTMP kinase